MKNLRLFLGASAIALVAATPAHAMFGYDVAEVRDMQIDGITFERHLAREYQSFALYEADRMVDWIDADHFAAKALAANNGSRPLPERTEDWNLDASDAAELSVARTSLMAAFDNGARETHPDGAARAQANFDCWMEQQEEDWQTRHINACKQAFYAALAGLTPEPVAQAPAQFKRIEEGAVLYFDHDSDALRMEARTTLATLAQQMRDDQEIGVTVTGHADRSGAADYNQDLSRRRAQTVVAALRNLGIAELGEVDRLDTEARGEAAPAVATGDGVREQANRRVVVQVFARERAGAMASAGRTN
jgi:OmpA-OmpF porin, OOP family